MLFPKKVVIPENSSSWITDICYSVLLTHMNWIQELRSLTPVPIGTEMNLSQDWLLVLFCLKKKNKGILLSGVHRVSGSHSGTYMRVPQKQNVNRTHPQYQEKFTDTDGLCAHICSGFLNFPLPTTGQKGASIHSGERTPPSKTCILALLVQRAKKSQNTGLTPFPLCE